MARRPAAMCAGLTIVLTCLSLVGAFLTTPVITPMFVADVDAFQYITYTLTTVAQDNHAYSVNITDLNAIAPSNYTIQWSTCAFCLDAAACPLRLMLFVRAVRINPARPDLPKPPILSDYDPSLVFVFGDVGETHTVCECFDCFSLNMTFFCFGPW